MTPRDFEQHGIRPLRRAFEPLDADTAHTLPLASAGLPPDAALIAFERGGQRRCLAARALAWHHAAQGVLGGAPFVVGLCGDCNTAVGLTPVLDGVTHHFHAVGMRHDLAALGDRESGSLWDLLTGECIGGPLTGRRLPFWPVEMTTVAGELAAHPDALLLRAPDAETAVQFPGRKRQTDGWCFEERPSKRRRRNAAADIDPRLPPRAFGLAVYDAARRARFYPLDALPPSGALDDRWPDGRGLRLTRNAAGLPDAVWQDDGTRPMQAVTRWAPFAAAYPAADIFGGAQTSVWRRLRALFGRR